MDCALWLNRRKIRDAAEIPRNLDIASLRGYFLAGSLVEWLNEHGGAVYAERLAKVPRDDPELNSRIFEIFGGEPLPVIQLDGKSADAVPGAGFGSFSTSYGSFITGFGSFRAWEILKTLGSFGSYVFTSGGLYEWEWEWERLFGSFGYTTSFTGSALGERFGLEWLLTAARFRSFGSFSSFPFGDIRELLGSYRGFPILDEYDLILLRTLLNCPLDKYGYGIHII